MNPTKNYQQKGKEKQMFEKKKSNPSGPTCFLSSKTKCLSPYQLHYNQIRPLAHIPKVLSTTYPDKCPDTYTVGLCVHSHHALSNDSK